MRLSLQFFLSYCRSFWFLTFPCTLRFSAAILLLYFLLLRRRPLRFPEFAGFTFADLLSYLLASSPSCVTSRPLLMAFAFFSRLLSLSHLFLRPRLSSGSIDVRSASASPLSDLHSSPTYLGCFPSRFSPPWLSFYSSAQPDSAFGSLLASAFALPAFFTSFVPFPGTFPHSLSGLFFVVGFRLFALFLLCAGFPFFFIWLCLYFRGSFIIVVSTSSPGSLTHSPLDFHPTPPTSFAPTLFGRFPIPRIVCPSSLARSTFAISFYSLFASPSVHVVCLCAILFFPGRRPFPLPGFIFVPASPARSPPLFPPFLRLPRPLACRFSSPSAHVLVSRLVLWFRLAFSILFSCLSSSCSCPYLLLSLLFFPCS